MPRLQTSELFVAFYVPNRAAGAEFGAELQVWGGEKGEELYTCLRWDTWGNDDTVQRACDDKLAYESHPSRPKNSSTYTSLLFTSFLICFEIAFSASSTILICVFAAGSLDAFASAGGEWWR